MRTEKYVLITPARNEGEFIENTIQSVISQSVLPLRWIIVSDGSTDQTNELVLKYIPENPWIELIKMPEHRDRNFAAKVHCFNAGLEKVKDLGYEIIGNIDADISFERDYFEFLMAQFADDPKLGVAGTPFVEDGKHYDYRFTNIEHVSGACQLFRRKCFEEIGGYIPIKEGGIDWVATTTARMKGWKTRSFVGKNCFHHRKMGTGTYSVLRASFKHGRKDYCLGNHPLWQLFRGLYQMTKKPYIFNGLLIIFGYGWASFNKIDRPIPIKLIQFVRHEQMERLRVKFLSSKKA
jgi:glycosyltransferase involved in cell wall biosynthesis